ncbi:CHASE2 domain-containing protein [Pantanalinema sp. GBBB05]|uniref:CHASE2 domain-containing protein n=1 Tax=Pantanalinema sp. GBBB05 TaxID=2604139 RepID=UPI001DA51209|nr:diguanylate cyclase [Pantanalinema sp. GBBB05]
MKRLARWRSLGAITIGVTTAVIGLQVSGALQLLEWEILNQWFRWRLPESRTVPIVLVTINDADLQWAGRWPLSDQQVAALLQRLHRDRPAAIGLDLYRDLPIQPGHTELLTAFRTIPNVIGISKAVGATAGSTVLPPPMLRDRNQVGVNDLLLDADGKVRRNLLAIDQHGQDKLALGTKLALIYLSQRGIIAQGGEAGSCTQLGKAQFCRLDPNAGGYVRADTSGNQTLSNFLRIPGGIPTVSLKQVMTNQVPASTIQDKIVFVGAKADSLWGDRFYTPYSTDSDTTWAGVEIHANVTAQIITSALDGRPLLQGIPECWEWGYILFWAGVGTALGWSLHSLRWTILLCPTAIVSVFAIAYSGFLLGWWVVAVSPALALLSAMLLSHVFWAWQALKQANQILELKVQERTQELVEKNLALEQARQVAESANQLLEHLARTDELTQVANRRFFNEYLNQEWYRMMREQLPLSLILLDIDCFKLYNDTYGHPAGDRCLSQVASTLQLTAKRPADRVARYGGEEFAIILPNTPLAGATQLANEIRSKIHHLQIPHESSYVSSHVTLSLGVVCIVPLPDVSLGQFISKADEALYQAKMQGRDRVVAVELPVR